MFRVQREMRNLANGTPTHSIQFRTSDFWMEFAAEFNAVRERVLLLEERVNAKPTESPPNVVETIDEALEQLSQSV